MKSALGNFSTQIDKTRRTLRGKTFIRCSLLFLTLGVGVLMGASSNQIPILIIANAQLEDAEFQLEQGQDPDDKETATTTGSNGLSLTLERAHFIPLSPLSDSPGNQVKMLLDYTIDNPSALADDTVSAIMEVYAENQTLLKTSSLPEPIVIDDSEGTIQLATTLADNPALQNITARALITDSQKVNPLSDAIEANIELGEIKSSTS
jgi:hypothetical protein